MFIPAIISKHDHEVRDTRHDHDGKLLFVSLLSLVSSRLPTRGTREQRDVQTCRR